MPLKFRMDDAESMAKRCRQKEEKQMKNRDCLRRPKYTHGQPNVPHATAPPARAANAASAGQYNVLDAQYPSENSEAFFHALDLNTLSCGEPLQQIETFVNSTGFNTLPGCASQFPVFNTINSPSFPSQPEPTSAETAAAPVVPWTSENISSAATEDGADSPGLADDQSGEGCFDPTSPMPLFIGEDVATQSSRAQSEASTLVLESSTVPETRQTQSLQVWIKSGAPPAWERTKQSLSPDYPTPPSRKRSAKDEDTPHHATKHRDGQTSHNMRRSKRLCGTTNTSRSKGRSAHNTAIGQRTRTANSSRAEGNNVRHTESADSKHGVLEPRQNCEPACLPSPRANSAVSQSLDSMTNAWAYQNQGGSLARGRNAAPLKECNTCGIDRTQLLQLTQNALRSVEHRNDAVAEASLMNGAPLSDSDREAILLRLSLGALRDYVMGLLLDIEAKPCTSQDGLLHPPIKPSCGVEPRADSVTSNSDVASFSDSDGLSEDEGAVSCDASDDEVSDVEPKNGPGRRARWSELEESRLRSYVREEKAWPWIAEKLCRTESAVVQHWKIMSRGLS